MPQLIFLPHEEICLEGAVVEAETGKTLIDAALDAGIEIEHACEKSCACTTCHVILREGFDSLEESGEEEDDMLDEAWGLGPGARIQALLPSQSRQRRLGDRDSQVHHQHGLRGSLT
jgi:2Fe-2S ferredoxin